MELVDGHLYVHLNLGNDPVKFRASRPNQQLTNGEWHKVGRIPSKVQTLQIQT